MTRQPPRFQLTATLCPFTTVFRSPAADIVMRAYEGGFDNIVSVGVQRKRNREGPAVFVQGDGVRHPLPALGDGQVVVGCARAQGSELCNGIEQAHETHIEDRTSTRLNASH